MVDSSRTIMTDAGFALETRVRADETKMQFTRAAISTDDHFSDTDDALAKLTELYNIQQDGKVTAVQVINTTTVYVQVDVNQAESKADYQMRSAALYAKDDDGTEVLYGVTVLQDPVFVHKDADGSYLGFGINTTVGRASNVVVVVDPANMVTQQVFEGTMKNYYTKAEVDAKFVTDDDFASKLPKNIATTDAANTFAKSQTLAGGATDGDGNPYITNKDAQAKVDAGVKTAASDAATKATAAQTAAEKHADDADKLLVKTADTTDWQKHSITAADGGNKYSFTTATTSDLVAEIQKMPLGYHTFYCQAGVNGNPSTQAIRGVAEITTAGSNPLGVGYVTDSTGAFWSYYIDNSGWKLKRSVDDSTAVHNGDQIGGRNLIVHTGELVGQMVSPDGSISSFDQSNAMKDTIPVTVGEWLTFHQETKNDASQCFRWAWLDKDGKIISRQSEGRNQISSRQVPANAVSMRVSYPNIGQVKLERGKVASDWSDAPEELSGGRNYAIGAQKLTATDNGSGNDYPYGLLYNINPDVWGKNVTISFTATVSGFTGISDKHLVSDPNPMISNVLNMAITNDYDNRGIVLPTSDGTYTAVWHGNIGQMTGKNSQGHFKINMNAGAKVTIENLMIELGDVRHDYVPAPEDMASKTDVANYQHVKLTADDGSAEYAWQDATMDLKELIKSLPLGVHTFLAAPNLKSAPTLTSGGLFRGLMHMASNMQTGTGYMVDSMTADAWSITCASGTVTFEKLASDANTVKDNHNGTVTVNGVSYTMVDLQKDDEGRLKYGDNLVLMANKPQAPTLVAGMDYAVNLPKWTVTLPQINGGASIVSVTVEYRKSGDTDWTSIQNEATTLTGHLTGLDGNSVYEIRAYVTNYAGDSPYSSTLSVKTIDDRVFGVSWDMGSDPTLTRTDAAVGLTAGINGAQNDFDSVGPWAKMDKTVTDDDGNRFVRIPKLYIKKTQDSGSATWQVSLSKIDDSWYLPKCFWDFENNKELDYVDVGRYQGTIASGKLQSKSGVQATNTQSIITFRADARANGTGYQLLDIHVIDMLQVLFIIEFATLDSQSIMHGLTSGASAQSVNGTGDSHAGSSGYATTNGPMDYRGVENMYGNLYQWVDGANFNGYTPWVCDDASKYQSDLFAAPYQKLSYTTASSGYISKMGYDSSHPYAQFATTATGSATTYYADYQYTTTSNTVADYGDFWSGYAGGGGAFYWGLGSSSSYTDSYRGSRLVKKALG